MGLELREAGKYITIYDGKFSVKTEKGEEGSVTRINKQGKEVTEKYYPKFTGKLMSIKVKDGNFGKTWNFGFIDQKDLYTLQLNYSNSFATAFLKMLPNIDLTKEMTISPSVKPDEKGVKRSSLFVNQDGIAIKHAYTKDNPNGLPQLRKLIVKGEEVWDDTEILEFLQKMVDETIIPKLNENAAKAGIAPQSNVSTPDEVELPSVEKSDDDEDIGF